MSNEPTTETPGRDLIAALAASRPDVAITVTRERDDLSVWDGDGPNPADEGCVCYEWIVTAMTIRGGALIEARVYLGGSWYEPEDRGVAYQEVSGYLPQMVREAVEELDQQLAHGGGQ